MAGGRFFELSEERLELLRARRRAEGLEAAEDALPRRPEGEAPPPSFSQERLWFLDRLAGGDAHLGIPAPLRLTGPLDRRALGRALADVVARHEPLRSTFSEPVGEPALGGDSSAGGGEVRVEVTPPAEAFRRHLPLPHADLTALPPDRRRPEMERLAGDVAAWAFDLARGPLLVGLLVELGGESHALLLAIHHVAADGWSLGVLFGDLARAYDAHRRPNSAGDTTPVAVPPAPTLAEPAVRYGDWAAWQRRRLSGERLAGEVEWWRDHLAGAPRVLDLPADRPAAPGEGFRGGTVRGAFDPALADRLRALGRGLADGEASPFMTLLALLALLLSRWSGEGDLVVGTPVAGRTRRETEGLVGLFLNHLALRIGVPREAGFRDLLAAARDTALGAFAHQEVPFERLLEELEVPRDLATTPLFQVFLNLLNFPPPAPFGGGELEVSPLAPARAPARFDLTLYADDRGPGGPLRLTLVYDARRFDAAPMEEALRQLTALAEQVVAEPERPLSTLSLVTAAARRALPDPGRRQDRSWPGPVHAAVDRHAAERPGAVAVVGPDGETVSYRRLAAASRALAGDLRRRGVGRGDVVAVHAHREAALVAAVLAIHRAGAAFLLLDPAYPAARNALCCARAAPAALVELEGAPGVPDEVREVLGEAPVMGLGRLRETGAWVEGGAAGDLPQVSPDDLAYVAFTSGSTGEPKGVLGLHLSLTHFLPWQAEAFSLGSGDRFSLLSGLAHDPLQRDLFTPLWVGGAVAIPDGERFGEPGYLAAWLGRAGVTVIHGTPSLLRLVGTGVRGAGGTVGGEGGWGPSDPSSIPHVPGSEGPQPRHRGRPLEGEGDGDGVASRAEDEGSRWGAGSPGREWGLDEGEGTVEVGGRESSDPSSIPHVPGSEDSQPQHRGRSAEGEGDGDGAAPRAGDEGSRWGAGSPGRTAGKGDGGPGWHLGVGSPREEEGEGKERGHRAAEPSPLPMGGGPGAAGSAVDQHRPKLPALRWAFLVGEALRGEDVERLQRLAPGALAVNLYGATETQRAVGWHAVTGRVGSAEVVPLGRGMPDVQLLVLTPAGGLAGIGEAGEVCVRSPHLAGGYLGRPGETAAAFLPDPFGTEGGRMYRTGDLGRYRPDGAVQPLGRRDRQVKVRGFRVEPAEVEAVMAGHPAVAEAAVVAVGEASDARLVGYWTVRDGSSLGAGELRHAELRQYLAARLPAAMVPADLLRLEAMPRTPNGKLDRAALPAVDATGGDGAPAHSPPATPSEELLAGLWREVLGDGPRTRHLGRDDDFFAVGGHSLALTRLLARVRAAFGVDLPVRRAFETPTLAGQAAAIDDLVRRGSVALEPPRPRDRAADPPPASSAQRRLWFLDRLAPGSAAYTLSAALDLHGALEPAALTSALTILVRRHEALRTTLPAPDGEPVQRVAAAGSVHVALPLADLAALPAKRRPAEAGRLAAASARQRFDLARGPLLAARLLRLGCEGTAGVPVHRLLLAVHHAVADGWSLGVMARELGALYTASLEEMAAGGGSGLPRFTLARRAGLPDLPVQYADWSLWQRRLLSGPELDEQVAWWRRELDGLPPALELPTDRPRGAREDHRGASVEHPLPAELVAAMERLGRRYGVTRYMLLLAALAVVLSRWSGQLDLAVGSPESGRGPRQVEPLVGLFLNLLVLRVDLTGEPTFGDLLGRVRQRVLGAFAHRDVPFERLLEEVAPARDPARPPLVEVLLNVLDAPAEATAFAGLDARLAPPVEREARFPLSLYAWGGSGVGAEGGPPLVLRLVYQRALFDAERMEELLGQMVAVLEDVVDEPERPVALVGGLTGVGRRVLADPGEELPVPEVEGVVEAFGRVVERWGERVAVVVGGVESVRGRAGGSGGDGGGAGGSRREPAGATRTPNGGRPPASESAPTSQHSETANQARFPSFPPEAPGPTASPADGAEGAEGVIASPAGGAEGGPGPPVSPLKGGEGDSRSAAAKAGSAEDGEAGVEGAPPTISLLMRKGASDRSTWTYRKLDEASGRAAEALVGAGVRRGEVVAVGGVPSFGLVSSLLAVWKAGGVLLLLDPALPEARRAEMLRLAGGGWQLTPAGGDGGGQATPGSGGSTAARGLTYVEETGAVALDDGRDDPADHEPRRFGPDVAYLFFTSGTTGRPKGVVGSHRGLAHFLAWQRESFEVGPGDRVAQLTALSFDVVLRDLLLPLTSGATLVLPADPALRLDPARVLPWLDAHGVTLVHAVPTLARSWLAGGVEGVELAALRWIFFAGEPLPAEPVEAWRRSFPASPSSMANSGIANSGIANFYGPTETTLARCAFVVPAPPEPGVQPVGRALPDSQALVLAAAPDGSGGTAYRRCGPGEVGEIVLRTPLRSHGYLDEQSDSENLPGSAFFPNPFHPDPLADEPADLLYASGDLGRFRLDGTLEILGRRDSQVKVRGVRLEPAEVEAALAAHPTVAAAAVVVEGEGAATHLVAWVVPATGAATGSESLDPRRLRAHLSRRLPPALVPSRFLPLDTLPTGATGKVDRAALPPVPAAEELSAGGRTAPRDDIEAALAEIFQEVLELPAVGVREGFFELGGHSLLAVPLLSRVESRFGRRLPLAALFTHPTVEELARLLRAAGVEAADESGAPSSSLVTLQEAADSRRPPLFLVHPGGGGVLCYADLATALGPDQPVHALQSAGLDGGEAPLTSIDAMAERYLADVTHVRPRGPYHLAGWSFGGRVVFEMARRLREAGEDVGLVALLDITPDPSPGPAHVRDDDDAALMARALAETFPVAADELRGLDHRSQVQRLLAAARERAAAAGRPLPEIDPARAEALLAVFKSNLAAARAFRQRPYPGPALLLRAADSDRFAAPAEGGSPGGDPTAGWGALAASVRVVTVPGDHHSMVRPPHVARLAAALRAALDGPAAASRNTL